MKEKKEIFYKNIPCDSILEYYFAAYLDELKSRRLVVNFKRAESFLLSGDISHEYKVETKKKGEKSVNEVILRSCSYTPDFEILFPVDLKGILFETLSSKNPVKDLLIANDLNNGFYQVFCEIKPDYDWNNKTMAFKYLQKWLYDQKGVFVNLVRIPSFFKRSFYPEKFNYTLRNKKRKINTNGFIFVDDYLKKYSYAIKNNKGLSGN